MADEQVVFNFVNPPGTGPIIRNDQGDAGGGEARDLIDFEQSTSKMFSINSLGLPDPGGGDPKRQIVVCIGDIIADSDALKFYLCQFEAACAITNIYCCINADTADGTSNGQTLLISESSGDLQVTTYSTAASNPGLADETWTTQGAVTNGDMVAGEYLYMQPTKVSSGLAMAGLTFLIEYTMTG